jgi:hypothetical protein
MPLQSKLQHRNQWLDQVMKWSSPVLNVLHREDRRAVQGIVGYGVPNG